MPESIRQGDIPGVQLQLRREILHPLEELWPWLVEPHRLARWAADEAAVEGGALWLGSAGTGEERGDTLDLQPPRLWILAFERAGWDTSTRLTLKLHRHADGAEIDLFHEGFQRLRPALALPAWEEYRRRWSLALDRLAGAVGEERL